MHPFSECPNWEYTDDPRHAQVLSSEAAKILQAIHEGNLSLKDAVLDTRGLHRKLFSRLAPPAMLYLAGSYRGQNYKCLLHRPVGVRSNPRVGSPAAVVHLDLRAFRKTAKATVAGLDNVMALPDAQIASSEKLKYLVAAACSLFSDFLIIHPYANGNGHIGRIMLTWILARYGYWLKKFPIDPRPGEPNYSTAILHYQSGQVEPLENLILSSIIDDA